MNYSVFSAFNRFESPINQMRTRLSKDLDDNIIWDEIFLNNFPNEIKIGLTCAGESHFDLFVTHLDKQLEHRKFPRWIHGINKRLISIAKIHRTPLRCLSDLRIGPGAIGKIDRGKWLITMYWRITWLLLWKVHLLLLKVGVGLPARPLPATGAPARWPLRGS